MRVGIIGCGRIATLIHLPSIRKISGYEVVAAADTCEVHLNEALDKFHISEGYLDYHDMLEKSDIDAVFVCTPPHTHFQIVMESIKHGKHVFCEKPIAITPEECLAIKRTLRKISERLVVMPAHNFIFTPCFTQALREVKEGTIGKLLKIIGRAASNLTFYKPKTDFRYHEREGVIEDQLSHIVYLCNTIGGTIQEILSVKPRIRESPVIDDITVNAKLEGGASAEMSAKWLNSIPLLQLDLIGTLGQIKMDLLKTPYNMVLIKDGESHNINMGRRRLHQILDILRFRHPSYTLEHLHFLECVKGNNKPHVTIDDGIKLAKALGKIIESIEESPRISKLRTEKVVILKVKDNVERVVENSIHLLGGLHVGRGKIVAIKPNVCYPKNVDGMILTDPRILEAVISIVKKKTNRILVVESDSVSGSAEKRMIRSGFMDIVERTGVEFLNLSKDEVEEHEVSGLTLQIPKTLLKADYVINLPKIKTHESVLISIAMKNMFGALANKKKFKLHSKLSDILVYINRVFRQDLIIVDGLIGMEGIGPIHGSPVKLGLIVAGTNPVTVDAVCCQIMGIDPYGVEAIWKAYKLGMGEINTKRVHILGEPIEKVKTKFRLPVYSPRNILSLLKTFLRVGVRR